MTTKMLTAAAGNDATVDVDFELPADLETADDIFAVPVVAGRVQQFESEQDNPFAEDEEAEVDDLRSFAEAEEQRRERQLFTTVPATVSAEAVCNWIVSQFSEKAQSGESNSLRFFTKEWLTKLIEIFGGAPEDRDDVLNLIKTTLEMRCGFFTVPDKPDVVGVVMYQRPIKTMTALPTVGAKKVGLHVPPAQATMLSLEARRQGMTVSDYLASSIAGGVRLKAVAEARGVSVEELLAQLNPTPAGE